MVFATWLGLVLTERIVVGRDGLVAKPAVETPIAQLHLVLGKSRNIAFLDFIIGRSHHLLHIVIDAVAVGT